MSGNIPGDRPFEGPDDAGDVPLATSAFPWLLLQKVAIPDPVPGYVDRPELVARANPTQRRLTILNATGGFGKTTLMAECCRRLRQEGVATAWVSLDERDGYCRPGTIVEPGGACTVYRLGYTFDVDANGRGCLRASFTGCSDRSVNFAFGSLTFVAARRDDNSWEIENVDPAPPD